VLDFGVEPHRSQESQTTGAIQLGVLRNLHLRPPFLRPIGCALAYACGEEIRAQRRHMASFETWPRDDADVVGIPIGTMQFLLRHSPPETTREVYSRRPR